MKKDTSKRKTITLQILEHCNLKCIYCYQTDKKTGMMSINDAKDAILRNINNSIENYDEILIEFLGGEPFLRFDFIVEICDWLNNQEFKKPIIAFATTNGTLIHGEIQKWLRENTNFKLCLSLDGLPETHNFNRGKNSYEKIDLDFFKDVYPTQPIKMTISEHSIENLCNNIIHLHELGFQIITGFAQGQDWEFEKIKPTLEKELRKLCDYYLENPDLEPCSLFDFNLYRIYINKPTKWCGIGNHIVAIDTKGKEHPCHAFLPSSYSEEENTEWNIKTKFDTPQGECKNCNVFNLCSTCYGMNMKHRGNPFKRDEQLCKLIKTQIKSVSYLNGKLIESDRFKYKNKKQLYDTIRAINTIQCENF